MRKQYPWKLSGPWYRGETVGGPPGRGESPIIQKYASTDFVDMFLEEPQRSLKFVCEDFANRVCLGGVYDTVSPATRQKGDSLKLFLDVHSRFYIVVCELYCQALGCPSVSRDQVCEAGFVVRRFRSGLDAEAQAELSPIMAERNLIMAKVGKVLPKYRKSVATLDPQFVQNPMAWLQKAEVNAISRKLADLCVDYEANTRRLGEFASRHDDAVVAQRWAVNPGLKGTGSWQDVEDDAPQEIDEEIHPLYPLIPDPAAKKHSAKGRTVYFGVVPTFSGDLDENGDPKFDVESAHEIRCFVRRHEQECPKKSERADCPGEIVWSQPTENYRLAAFLDPDGSGHRPINIRLPDLNELEAQALRGPAGKGLNVRMMSPPKSALKAAKKSQGMGMGGKGDWKIEERETLLGTQICFFSIPLITIVAMFVLRIFLPIVVFLFGLWFLLKLKICIPPSFSFDAKVAADLKAFGPDFKTNIDAEIATEGSIKIGEEWYGDSNRDKLVEDLQTMLSADENFPGYLKDGCKTLIADDFDVAVDTIIGMAVDFSDDPEVPAMAAEPPQATDGVFYFPTVSPP